MQRIVQYRYFSIKKCLKKVVFRKIAYLIYFACIFQSWNALIFAKFSLHFMFLFFVCSLQTQIVIQLQLNLPGSQHYKQKDRLSLYMK